MSRPPGVWLFLILNIFAGLYFLLHASQAALQIETVFSVFFAGSSFALSFNIFRLNRLAHVGCAARLLLLLWAGLFRHSLPTELAACGLLSVLLSTPVRNAFWKGPSGYSIANLGLRSAKNSFKRPDSATQSPNGFVKKCPPIRLRESPELGITNTRHEAVRRSLRQSSFRFKQ